jgi:flagellar biosynthesis protein FliR
MEPNYLDFWFPFLLIFARLVAFVAILPLFSWRGIPILLRVFFALLVSVLLALNWEGSLALPGSDLQMVLLLGRELIIGLSFGYLVYLFLSVFLMSGQFMDHKAGLMMAGTFDPLFGGQITLLGQFFYFLAVVFYLTINGHHLLFFSLKESFNLIPLGGPFLPALTSMLFMTWPFLRASRKRCGVGSSVLSSSPAKSCKSSHRNCCTGAPLTMPGSQGLSLILLKRHPHNRFLQSIFLPSHI